MKCKKKEKYLLDSGICNKLSLYTYKCTVDKCKCKLIK